jgi:hypothetical protein
MKVYHGNCINNFTINRFQNSRYGLKALFATPNIELARLYAVYHYRQSYQNAGGYIYSFDIDDEFFLLDYQGKLSYTSEFRRMIYENSKSDVLYIKNVIDYPHKSMRQFNLSDIVAIFNFDVINHIELIEKNVTAVF